MIDKLRYRIKEPSFWLMTAILLAAEIGVWVVAFHTYDPPHDWWKIVLGFGWIPIALWFFTALEDDDTSWGGFG